MVGRKRLHPPSEGCLALAIGIGGGAMTGSAEHRRPGLARAEDGFVLAPNLSADGAVPIGDALNDTFSSWDAQVASDRVDAKTVVTYKKIARTLGAYAKARQVTLVSDVTSELLWSWVNSPATGTRAAEYPSDNIRKQRRAAANSLYTTWYLLGITERNIAASLPKVAAVRRHVAALTASEIQRLKDHADYDTRGSNYEAGYSRTPSCLALALLGAQPGEIGAIRVQDLDQLQRAVFLHGGGSRYMERWVPIDDDWSWQAILDRLAYLNKTHPNDLNALLAYRPFDPAAAEDFSRRSAATSSTLAKLMKAAGVYRPGENRAASITEHVAARVFDQTGRVEAVAARLGMNSLDGAAHLVAYDWRNRYDPDPRERS